MLALGWCWALTIVWLSLTPSPPTLDVEQGDKLQHLAAYGTLMFWFCQLYPRRLTRLAYAAGFCAMGVALEFLQGMTDYRTFDVHDMLANAAGVLLGWAAAAALRGIIRPR
jgi:hypothetical protein